MDRSELLDVMREVAAEVLSADPDAVAEDSRFREDLGADSLDLIEMMTMVEDRLGLRISPSALKDIATISQALDYFLTVAPQADAH